jgi:hypothetical protein
MREKRPQIDMCLRKITRRPGLERHEEGMQDLVCCVAFYFVSMTRTSEVLTRGFDFKT